MIETRKNETRKSIINLKDMYLQELLEPIDAFWEDSVVLNSVYYEITFNSELIGYFCIIDNKILVQFYISPEYNEYNKCIFKLIINKYKIESALVSTLEPVYMSLCLELNNNVEINSYIYYDKQKLSLNVKVFDNLEFELANISDFDKIKKFYIDNTNNSGEWLYYFLSNLIINNQLYILHDNKEYWGVGEFRLNKYFKSYVDLGVVVSHKKRNEGIGSYILIKLKEQSYLNNNKAICLCERDNIESNKMIKKSGFIWKHSIFKVSFR